MWLKFLGSLNPFGVDFHNAYLLTLDSLLLTVRWLRRTGRLYAC